MYFFYLFNKKIIIKKQSKPFRKTTEKILW